MAENKKSIIVYADWIELFESLSDEEAGLLIKHFFRYVNDLNPTAPDRITELSFIPLKQALKRDLDKWETTLEERSINGRKGNLKKYNPDLYIQFELGKYTLEEAELIAKSRKASLPDSVATKTLANVAVNVNDNVNVNVNDNVNDNDIKNSVNKFTAPTLLDVETYFTENGFDKQLAKRAFDYYDVANWKDSKGNQVKNWRQKMRGVWFKEENKEIVKPKFDPFSGPIA